MEECINGGWKIKGVRSRNTGALYADAVVCTLNAWANSLLATVDQLIPAHNYVHERFVNTPFAQAPAVSTVNDSVAQVYYRPTEDNRLLFGAYAHEPVRITTPGTDFDYAQLQQHPPPVPLSRRPLASICR